MALTKLKELQCGTCGVWFAVPEKMYETLREEGGFFSCPNGHSRGWDKGSLRKENERLKQDQARLEQELAAAHTRIDATNRQMTKMRARASKGVCPCCNRTFVNMQRHMATKHPDFRTAEIVPIKKAAP